MSDLLVILAFNPGLSLPTQFVILRPKFLFLFRGQILGRLLRQRSPKDGKIDCFDCGVRSFVLVMTGHFCEQLGKPVMINGHKITSFTPKKKSNNQIQKKVAPTLDFGFVNKILCAN